jgi:hypothetical protein
MYKVGDKVTLAHATTADGRYVGEGRIGTVLQDANSVQATVHVDWEDFVGHDRGRGAGSICTGHCYWVEKQCIELTSFTESNCPVKEQHPFVKAMNCPFCGAQIKK